MDDQLQTPPPDGEPAQPGLKFLETSVYIMGGLLVVMFIVLVGGIVWKVKNRGEPPIEAPKIFGAGIAPGTQIDSVALDGDRLAIKTADEVVVVDVKKGTVISRIRLYER
jgi:hypothetical protein